MAVDLTEYLNLASEVYLRQNDPNYLSGWVDKTGEALASMNHVDYFGADPGVDVYEKTNATGGSDIVIAYDGCVIRVRSLNLRHP